jgi:hypothetical protein
MESHRAQSAVSSAPVKLSDRAKRVQIQNNRESMIVDAGPKRDDAWPVTRANVRKLSKYIKQQ